MSTDPATYLSLGEAGWRWVLDQVRWDDDGPWVPTTVPPDEAVPGHGAAPAPTAADRDGLHSGLGGLAHVLAEVRLLRPWTDEEAALAEGIAARLAGRAVDLEDCTYFDGLVSTIGALTALGAPGVEAAVSRLGGLATPDGWPQGVVGPPRATPQARINDVTLGTAGVLLGALWARRHGVAAATAVAEHAAEVLLAEAEPAGAGSTWRFVPLRFRAEPGVPTEMPNFSHGVAGIGAALAVAGLELGRPDLVAAAAAGAAYLVSIGDARDGGFVVPRYVPPIEGEDPVTFSWCHGPAGTSRLFAALDAAGAVDVAGEGPAAWHARCLRSVRTSGLPARVRPGFWDNDGRCCGTAGVADVVLDAWQRDGGVDNLAFTRVLADAMVDRAIVAGPRAWWRFVEHRADVPLLAPGTGWMQGVAGIAAHLLRAGRVLRDGRDAPAVARLDTWWALP